MEIPMTRFGTIHIDDNKAITFDDGIIGFEQYKRYVLLSVNNNSKFYWLQSIDEPDLAFACMDPLNVCDDYSPKIDKGIFDELQTENSEILVLCVVVIKTDISQSTVNLAAPIIINTDKQKAKQVVLQNDKYNPRHLVFK